MGIVVSQPKEKDLVEFLCMVCKFLKFLNSSIFFLNSRKSILLLSFISHLSSSLLGQRIS